MIWPFKRKPKPLNPGPINEDWAVGDLAECTAESGGWIDDLTGKDDAGPDRGDVLRVSGVRVARLKRAPDSWMLKLGRDWYTAEHFRKVAPMNSAADAEFTAQIKSLKPKRVRA